MADQLFVGTTPNNTAFDGSGHGLGAEFTVSSNVSAIGGGAWYPNTTPGTFFWQLWRVSDTTLLAEVNLSALGGITNNAWNYFTSASFITPGDVPLVTTESYVVNIYTTGDFVYRNPFSGYPVTVGVLSSPNSRFVNGQPQNTFPGSTNTTDMFFADITVEAAVATGTLQVTIPALEFDATGELTASGILAATLPLVDFDADGVLTAAGILNATLPLVDFDADGTLRTSGVLNATLPLVDFDADGELSAAGILNVTLPPIDFDADGALSASGILDATLPGLIFNAVGSVEVPVTGVLNVNIPAIVFEAVGSSAAGGSTVGPCSWTIPDPLCADDWAGFSADIKSSARDYAATVLWAATGRQFGLCQVQVRPCGMKRCNDGGAEFFGYDWSGGTWTPYIFNGTWFNCMCGAVCCCEPRCQVRLMGPVNEIVEVTIGGIAVDPDTYRVDDEHWLVRQNTNDCWPICSDLETDDGDNVFIVTYLRGEPVPASLLRAASTLALEWARGCAGGTCRLSNRVTNLARNGVTIDLLDPSEVLEGGLTGLWEVDQIIRVFNPGRLDRRLRVWAPELSVPRTTTWP